MRERLIQCLNYLYEGKCSIKDKKCHFWKEMQKCKQYIKKPNSLPIRVDNHKKKIEEIKKKERGVYDE